MKYTCLLTILCASLTTLAQSVQPSYAALDNLNWLTGTWVNHTARGDVYETWERTDDSTYSGVSYHMVNAGRSVHETITLQQRNGVIQYIPVVKNQNNGEAVAFTLVSGKRKQFVFENKAHDFPTRISYQPITGDSLVAEISGNVKGNAKTIQFGMVRVYSNDTSMPNNMKLGAFSMSLAVKDLAVSKAFYEKLGFTAFGGSMKQHYLIMKNGTTLIGLFQGMFQNNILTFNPGWDEDAKNVAQFDDVREIQRKLKASNITLQTEADENTSGPASIMLTDPDGNLILIDQHR